jgi:protein SCO1/2
MSDVPEQAVLDSSPGKLGRITGRPVFWVVVVVLLSLVPLGHALGRKLPDPPPKMYTLPEFQLTSEKNLPYGSEQLKGKVWVASFVFTSCPSVCPALMEKMQDVQHRTRNAGAAVQLVTFTVDPENDTPEVLHDYARRFKASPYRWTFLTGDYKVLEDTIVRGFKLAMGKDADNLFEIFHSERFVLIDGEGRIRGYYDATDEGVEKLSSDITLVLNFG